MYKTNAQKEFIAMQDADERLFIDSTIFNREGDYDLKGTPYNLTWSISLNEGEKYLPLIEEIKQAVKSMSNEASLKDRSELYPPNTGSLLNVFAKDASTLYVIAKSIIGGIGDLYNKRDESLFLPRKFKLEAERIENLSR